MAGRFAPSPSGPLHLGNLRTALVAWLAARSAGLAFYVRVEDLDPATSSREHERQQLEDLARLGLDWDQPVVRQSERLELYRDAINELDRQGRVYRCYCTRREIREEIERASRAPQREAAMDVHDTLDPNVLQPDGAYPGTCRDGRQDEHQDGRQDGYIGEVAQRSIDRQPALRLRANEEIRMVADVIAGEVYGAVDDFVLARADQLPAYNLAVVVDDHLQGITQVVRGDDLLSSTPRHLLLYDLFGWTAPHYWHVPLVMDGDVRLAKRSGGVTTAELYQLGWSPERVIGSLAHSIGLLEHPQPVSAEELLQRFDVDRLALSPTDVTRLTGSM